MSRPADPSRYVRPGVRALSVYTLEQAPWRFKLDQNEVPWELPPPLRRRILARLAERPWAIYPDFHSRELCRALARHHDHPFDGVLAGSGSGELLNATLDALVPPGGEVLGTVPSFGLYRMLVERAAGVARFLGPRPDALLPFEELLAELERDPRRPLILCSPNNPTGDALTVDQVERLLERLEAPMLLDNAYGELCRHDYLPLLARHRHLLIFRTFSKAWSLAGLRLGYVLGDPALVGELLKLKLPYNVGHAAEVAGLEVLAAAELLERRTRVIVARRRQWHEMLTQRGFTCPPSETNFLLARCPGGDARRIHQGLAQRGILVRDVSRSPGLADCVRITIGTGPALRATAAALDEILGEAP